MFSLHTAVPQEFLVEGDVTIRVLLRPSNDEESKRGYEYHTTMCEAHAEFSPNDKTLAVFNAIEDGTLRGTEHSYSSGYKDATGAIVYLPPELPENFVDFFRRANKAMSNAIAQIIHNVRWRTDAYGPHRAISVIGLYWSVDGATWYPAPPSHNVYVEQLGFTRSIGAAEKADIQALIQSNVTAPLHHEMFREAWHQRLQNPRSAMVIGIASLEIAVKHCIGTLVPDAHWLAENSPTPPVVTILTDYLPALPLKQRLPSDSVFPPKFVVDTLKKGVTIRNGLAHAGRFTPTRTSIDEILSCVKDTLWMVDYFCGHAWAYAHISPETRAAIEANSA
ncbi:hypothetical protein [Paraburkholderia aspalathi]|uniref:hypothetical protein n=1 Tax=Paraburkholderia aspalathi TaxID=1324617 RepID=UPI0038B73AB2